MAAAAGVTWPLAAVVVAGLAGLAAVLIARARWTRPRHLRLRLTVELHALDDGPADTPALPSPSDNRVPGAGPP